MQCIEKNKHSEEGLRSKICDKEFKAFRMTAFEDKMLYHHINKKYCMDELLAQNNESPY